MFYSCLTNKPLYMVPVLIAQLVEHEIYNLRITSSSPALGIRKNGPPVHSTVK